MTIHVQYQLSLIEVVDVCMLFNRKAVMAILTHPVQGEHALNFCTAKDETPMRLLVTHMPGKSKLQVTHYLDFLEEFLHAYQ